MQTPSSMLSIVKRDLNKLGKDFQELDVSKIKIQIKTLKTGSMAAWKYPYRINIDPIKWRDARNSYFIGTLAHELCHLVKASKLNFSSYWIYITKYYLGAYFYFKEYAREDEIWTDKEAIRRGYARKLASSRGYRLKKASKQVLAKIGKNYMTPKEIKLYAKSIKKW